MRDRMGVPAPVDLSVRLYTRLLAAYPGSFRAEYAGPMAQVFRDVCRRDYRRGGLSAMAGLWARTSLDLIRTTVEEHIDRGLDMNREKFVRWSGWALIAGAVLFAAGLILGNFDSQWQDPIGGVDAFYEISQIVGISLGQILFVIGLLGLRAGYAARSGGLGAALLITSVIGGLASLGGLLVMNAVEVGWTLWIGGLVLMTLALALYGLVAMRRKVFARWNFAPLLAGVTVPTLFFLGVILETNGRSLGEWTFPLGVAAMGAGLALLGFRMQAEADGIEATA